MTALVVSEARVPVAPYQQVPGQDLTAMGTLPQGSIDNVVENVLIAGVGYTGMGVSQVGTSTILTVQPGYLIKGGPAYALRDAFQVDVSSAINAVPDSAKFIAVAIVADGQEFQTEETRTFVDASKLPPNPTTPAPTTTQATPTRIVRSVVISSPKGAADVQPDLPSFSSTLCLLATVIVSATGIVSVTQNTATQITRLDELVPIVMGLSTTVAAQGLLVAGLQSSLAALAADENSRLTSLAAELAALKQLLNNLNTQQVVQANGGSVYTVVDYFLNDSLSTPSAPNYNAATGSGLTFPATNTPATFAPRNPYDAKLSLVGNKLTVAYTESLSGGTPGDTISAAYAYMNSFPALSGGTQQRGFGVNRLRYGVAFSAEATTQLQVSGDPTKIFGINPGDLAYDPSWDLWTKYNPELLHQAGCWSDLTSRGFWTPRSTGAPLTGLTGLSQYTLVRSTFMLTTFNLAIVKNGAGIMRMLVCDDLGGAPDFSRVLADVTVNNSDIAADTCSFKMPYPILQKQGKGYHYVFLTNGTHIIRLAPPVAAGGNSQLNGQILAPGPNGGWFKYSNAAEVGSQYFQATFYQQDIAPIPLEPFYQGGGTDSLDILTPAIVPDGCAIQYGMYRPDNTFQPFGPVTAAQPNLLAGRPSSVAVFMNLLGGNNVRPIIDLGTSASGASHVATAKQAGDFLNESDTRLVPNGGTVTTITETVILKGFNPAAGHTFSEALEIGASFGTIQPVSSVSTPMVQADGTTVITTTWTGFTTPLSTWRLRRVGHTADSQQPFKVVQASMTAK